MYTVAIEAQPIDPGVLSQDFARSPEHTGAVLSFVGYVRGAGITALSLEHYPGMTEGSIQGTVDSACKRWPLQGVRVVHRVGELLPGDPIVYLAVASAHRAAAFSACEFIMDYLKVSAPLWKKERNAEGQWSWVDAKETDLLRARRWSQPISDRTQERKP